MLKISRFIQSLTNNQKAFLISLLVHGILFILMLLVFNISVKDTQSVKIAEIIAVNSGGQNNDGGINYAGGKEQATEQVASVQDFAEDSELEDYTQEAVDNNAIAPQYTKHNRAETSKNRNHNVNHQATTHSNSFNTKGSTLKGQRTGPGGPGGNSQGGGSGGINGNTIYGTSSVDIAPQAIKRIKPNYPQYLADEGIEGTTIVQVVVDRAGNVESGIIVKSSGNKVLDREALKAANGFRFSPAKIKNIAVRCKINLPFTFSIS